MKEHNKYVYWTDEKGKKHRTLWEVFYKPLTKEERLKRLTEMYSHSYTPPSFFDSKNND